MFQRSKKNLLLLEMMIVLFFFAISTMITLQVFASAHKTGNENSYATCAMIYAQDWGSRIYGSESPIDALLDEGWQASEEGLSLHTEDGYILWAQILSEHFPAGLFYHIDINVSRNTPSGDTLHILVLPCGYYLPSKKEAIR